MGEFLNVEATGFGEALLDETNSSAKSKKDSNDDIKNNAISLCINVWHTKNDEEETGNNYQKTFRDNVWHDQSDDKISLYSKYTNFVPLKRFNTKNYYGVVGCYVIKNCNNDKCCVGQSKNIGKRIEQHFNGTKPRNYIFADDYYEAANRDNLFEIYVIQCSKEELDDLEKN